MPSLNGVSAPANESGQASEKSNRTRRHMHYTGGTLARDEPDTPWRAAQWVPVAGPKRLLGIDRSHGVPRCNFRCALAARRQERSCSWLRTSPEADAGVWQKAAPAAVEGLATAAQAADAGVWQKAVPAAVEGRDQRCFGGAAHSVYRRVVLRVRCVPHRSRTVHVRCGGCAWRSCVCIPTPTTE